MTEYKTFDQILRDENGDNQARVDYTLEWLKARYDIDMPADLASELTRVHDHDNLAYHFGQLKLATAFENVWVQVEKTSSTAWSLTYSFSAEDEAAKILPHKNDLKQDQEPREKIQRIINSLGGPTLESIQSGNLQAIIDAQILNPASDKANEGPETFNHMPLSVYLADPNTPSIEVDLTPWLNQLKK